MPIICGNKYSVRDEDVLTDMDPTAGYYAGLIAYIGATADIEKGVIRYFRSHKRRDPGNCHIVADTDP